MAATTWNIDRSHSTVGFRIRHMVAQQLEPLARAGLDQTCDQQSVDRSVGFKFAGQAV